MPKPLLLNRPGKHFSVYSIVYYNPNADINLFGETIVKVKISKDKYHSIKSQFDVQKLAISGYIEFPLANNFDQVDRMIDYFVEKHEKKELPTRQEIESLKIEMKILGI